MRYWLSVFPPVDVKLITEGPSHCHCRVGSALGRIIRVLQAGSLFSYAIFRIRPLGALLIFEITLPLSSTPQDGPNVHCPAHSLARPYPGSTSEHNCASCGKLPAAPFYPSSSIRNDLFLESVLDFISILCLSQTWTAGMDSQPRVFPQRVFFVPLVS